jgi:hypothetical protein
LSIAITQTSKQIIEVAGKEESCLANRELTNLPVEEN